jgi:hypothetical protein
MQIDRSQTTANLDISRQPPQPYPWLTRRPITRKGYKLCRQCGQPVLKKGQQRKHPDDYRHARGCPNADE